MTLPDAFLPPAVVLDSNVVFDWLVFGNPGVAPVVQAIESRQLRWLVSAAMRDELADVLARGVLSTWAPDSAALWAAWARWAQAVHAPPSTGAARRLVCRDQDDQTFIDLALAHGARWLLSRDRAVLALARRCAPLGLTICTPERWAP
jgi:predicted nucleic acid-binding protein